MSAHDRHLAAYRAYTTTAWCAYPECAEYAQAIIVDYEEEYGQGTITPEECLSCGANLTLDAPQTP
jgi:hypothetical protein